MTLQALDARGAGQVFGLTNYGKLHDNFDWLIAGQRKYGTKTSSVTTTGTSFAAGADLLASALAFTADGVSNYILRALAYEWFNNTASQTCALQVNLDGAAGALMGQLDVEIGTGSKGVPLDVYAILLAPAAGAHTVNARLRVSGGTGTVSADVGTAGAATPLIVSIERAEP